MLIRNLSVLCLALTALLVASGGEPIRRDTVKLVAVGDILFARGVGKQIERHSADWLFSHVKRTISGADIAFCNLECPLSLRGVPRRRKFLFRADPKYANTLKANGFGVVSVANNHTLDYGREALTDTISALRSAGVTPVGAGANRSKALELKIIRRKSLKIGVLAYSDMPSDGVVRLSDKPTIAGLEPDELSEQIKTASQKCDTLVVSLHWGVEYMKKPTEHQRAIARQCIDAGADLIIGHHPHVLQPTEIYKGKPIIYSAGAFVWDSKIFGADRSAIYEVEMGRNAARLSRTLPVKITDCRPVMTR